MSTDRVVKTSNLPMFDHIGISENMPADRIPGIDDSSYMLHMPDTSRRQLNGGSLKKNNLDKSVVCFVCYDFVCINEYENHMYFGKLKCSSCKVIINTCKDFVSERKKCFLTDTCAHEHVFWLKNPCRYLMNIWKKTCRDQDLLQNVMEVYLKSVSHVQYLQPWKEAFKTCNKFRLKAGEFNHLSTFSDNKDKLKKFNELWNSGKNSSEVSEASRIGFGVDIRQKDPEDVIRNILNESGMLCHNIDSNKSKPVSDEHEVGELLHSKSAIDREPIYKYFIEDRKQMQATVPNSTEMENRPDGFSKKKKKRTTIIVCSREGERDTCIIPDDKHFLLSDKPLEECPMCYTKFHLESLVFSLDSKLIKCYCCLCDVFVYVALKTPPGTLKTSYKLKKCTLKD